MINEKAQIFTGDLCLFLEFHHTIQLKKQKSLKNFIFNVLCIHNTIYIIILR